MRTSIQGVVDAVKAETDLVSLVSETISLKPSGQCFKGRSPAHKDSDPSFVVWPRSQRFKDYSGGGGASGDCFDFLQWQKGCSFIEALEELAGRAGVPFTQTHLTAEQTENLQRQRDTQDLLTCFAEHFHRALPDRLRKAWFVERYGLEEETLRFFQLGYAAGDLFETFRKRDISTEALLRTGMFVRFKDGSIRDFFQGRLMFPCWNRGKVQSFIGRRVHEEEAPWNQAKYLKPLTRSEKHPYVGENVGPKFFWGEGQLEKPDCLVLTEGVTDFPAAWQAGIPAVALLSSHVAHGDSAALVKLCQKAQRIVVCNDVEENQAGLKGALKTAELLLCHGIDVRIAQLPQGPPGEKVDLNNCLQSLSADAT